jgi:PKHD-type hydroxylase
MKALWSHTQAFTPCQCEQIINSAKKQKPSWAQTGGTPELKKTFEHRRSKLVWIPENHPELHFVHRVFWDIVTRMNNEYFKAHITSLPPLQFTQYSEQYQGEYKLHMDLDWLDANGIASQYGHQRKVSAIVQLSDPNTYEGGDFEFGHEVREKPNCHEIRKQGTLMAFPSFLHHGVRPVTKGKRYSLVGWFEGPPWR